MVSFLSLSLSLFLSFSHQVGLRESGHTRVEVLWRDSRRDSFSGALFLLQGSGQLLSKEQSNYDQNDKDDKQDKEDD